MGAFAHRFPQRHAEWAENSGYLVVLAADEATLIEVASVALSHLLVREPDLGDIPTAVALLGGDYWPHLSQLPLAGREVAMSG